MPSGPQQTRHVRTSQARMRGHRSGLALARAGRGAQLARLALAKAFARAAQATVNPAVGLAHRAIGLQNHRPLGQPSLQRGLP